VQASNSALNGLKSSCEFAQPPTERERTRRIAVREACFD
jgi:hypothetical protein